MEQVGEKQDFESELTRHGMCHEDFELYVRPSAPRHDEWNQDYIVTVYASTAGRCHLYTGGPRQNWVAEFAIDLARGSYGRTSPEDRPAIASPQSNPKESSFLHQRPNR
jgi:osmotically-inducible protein OsmY